MGGLLEEKVNKEGWVGGRGNSSSKAVGVNVADRPKAKNNLTIERSVNKITN
jgi:hypothetical protein